MIFLVVILWYWHLQNARASWGRWSALSPIPSSIPSLGTLPHNTKSQMLSMTPSCLQTSTTWVTLTLSSLTTSTRFNLGHLWTQLACTDSKERLPRRFHLNDAGLFLITTDFSLISIKCPINQKDYFSSPGILLITADCLASANQNDIFLPQNSQLPW